LSGTGFDGGRTGFHLLDEIGHVLRFLRRRIEVARQRRLRRLQVGLERGFAARKQRQARRQQPQLHVLAHETRGGVTQDNAFAPLGGVTAVGVLKPRDGFPAGQQTARA